MSAQCIEKYSLPGLKHLSKRFFLKAPSTQKEGGFLTLSRELSAMSRFINLLLLTFHFGGNYVLIIQKYLNRDQKIFPA